MDNSTLIQSLITYAVYIYLAQRIVRSAIKYRLFSDVRVAFYISAFCWVYFVFVYTVVLVGVLTGLDVPITLENFREYTRVFGLPLLVSTTYLINRIFP